MSRELIVAVFPSRIMLTRALDHLMEHNEWGIQHTAIVAKANTGEVVILDDNIGADEGGIAGGTLGAALTLFSIAQLGALALPGIGPIIALGAGALVGGLVGSVTGRFAANLRESGFKREQIEALVKQLESGHPAMVIEVKDALDALPRLKDALKPYRAELVERVRAAMLR
ncbi:MAG: hypothetical protein SGI73_15625 [Chloroflexota bacterium]|nr:hypothetical protein [Chloroflexota bacterium]